MEQKQLKLEQKKNNNNKNKLNNKQDSVGSLCCTRMVEGGEINEEMTVLFLI